MEYATAARALAAFYEVKLAGSAQRRIRSLRALSAMLGNDGVLQVEACPFHSSSLPDKRKLLRLFGEDPVLRRYEERLREFLTNQPVVIVSAAPSGRSLNSTTPISEWAAWQAAVSNLDLTRADFVPLVKKGTKTTSGAFVSVRDGLAKTLVLTMGGNHLPGDAGLAALADHIHSLN
jgi:hypothetical protein